MALTSVDICNLALAQLNAKAITSLSDGSTEASVCNRFYDIVTNSLLREYPWSWAITRVELTADTVPTEYEDKWSYAYQYPSDCLAIRKLLAEDCATKHDYEVIVVVVPGTPPAADTEAKLILCDIDDAKIEYSRAIEDPDLYDPMFVEAVAAKLAARIAFPLTKDSDTVKAAALEARLAVGRAMEADTMEGSVMVAADSSWVTDRVNQ